MHYWMCTWSSPESSLTSSSIVQGISVHYRVILEVEWEDNWREPQGERVVPVYNKVDVLGLQTFLHNKLQYGEVTVAEWRRYGIIQEYSI
jgi:hypothetical protein